jgi:hypothetical protein
MRTATHAWTTMDPIRRINDSAMGRQEAAATGPVRRIARFGTL